MPGPVLIARRGNLCWGLKGLLAGGLHTGELYAGGLYARGSRTRNCNGPGLANYTLEGKKRTLAMNILGKWASIVVRRGRARILEKRIAETIEV